jgi:hypothetical protein
MTYDCKTWLDEQSRRASLSPVGHVLIEVGGPLRRGMCCKTIFTTKWQASLRSFIDEDDVSAAALAALHAGAKRRHFGFGRVTRHVDQRSVAAGGA